MAWKFNPFTLSLDQVGSGTSTTLQLTTGSVLGEYKVDTSVGGDPASGYIRYNNATQTSSTIITVDHITNNGVDIDVFLQLLSTANRFIIQDLNESDNYQIWTIASTPIHSGATYWSIPVTFVTSGGTGTTNFANNHQIFLAVFAAGSTSSQAVDLVSYTNYGGF